MKISYVVPGLMPEEEARRREGLLRGWASAGTQVDVVTVDEGPLSIESVYEELICVRAMAEKVMDLEALGYDAAIVGCAGDPGLDAVRELTTRMLVTGPGEASFHAAAMLGRRFGLLTLDEGMVAMGFEQAAKIGVGSRLVSVVSVDTPVLALTQDRDKTFGRIVAACQKAIAAQHVDTMVIGCMTMGFMTMAKELEEAIGIPVVNPANVCLKFTEALVSCGLMHSKAAFAVPPKIALGTARDYRDLFHTRG